jgi:hypothetical protein
MVTLSGFDLPHVVFPIVMCCVVLLSQRCFSSSMTEEPFWALSHLSRSLPTPLSLLSLFVSLSLVVCVWGVGGRGGEYGAPKACSNLPPILNGTEIGYISSTRFASNLISLEARLLPSTGADRGGRELPR